jgi:uncharacterized protein (TIGR00369 family)
MADDPPEGFVTVARAPFVNHVGPIYQWSNPEPGSMRLGLRVAEVHTNSFGFMHGGMAATLSDSAMARALVGYLGRRAVTLRMSLDYLDTLNLGDWLDVGARVISHDDMVAHTECEIRVGDSVRVRAAAVFRLLRKR